MSLIGIAWVIIIILKIAGLAFLSASWWLVILWPLVPAVIILILGAIGITAASFWSR